MLIPLAIPVLARADPSPPTLKPKELVLVEGLLML